MAERFNLRAFLRTQHPAAWVSGSVMLAAATWFFGWQIANPRCAVPHYQFQPGAVVSYLKLLAEYAVEPVCLDPYDGMMLFMLCLATLFALSLAFLTALVWVVSRGSKWLLTTALGFAVVVLSCGSLWQMALSNDGTPLTHLQTVRFNGHVAHLARVVYPEGGMDFSDLVLHYVFVCDPSGESCSGTEVRDDYLGNHGQYVLEVNDETHQLNVYRIDSHGDKLSIARIEVPIESMP